MKILTRAEDGSVGFYCPACKHAHVIRTGSGQWTWNEDRDRPTISPSILVTRLPSPFRCHSFVRDGRIEFCGDSTHRLSGQTVDLPHFPCGYGGFDQLPQPGEDGGA